MTQEEENLVKYWYYRSRLQYFMIQGINEGESQVAGIRNYNNSNALHYGQQSAYLGDYIGVLATEYYLLNQSGQDVNQTLRELYYALQTYIENMDKCESDYPWESFNMSDQYDGFFMRNNVPNDFVSTHPELNKNVLPGTTHSGGDPGWVNLVSSNMCSNPFVEILSQDEAIFLLRNLALVKKLVPNSGFYNETGVYHNFDYNDVSIEIASKIIHFIQYCPYGNNPFNWVFYSPDGVNPNIGNDATAFQHGFRGTDKYFRGAYNGITLPPMLLVWDAIPYTVAPLRTDVAHMTSSLAAISNNWAINIALFWGSIRVPANTLNIKVCADQHNWDTFYLLLWEILQGETTNRLDMQKVRDQLNAAPGKGPYAESATVFFRKRLGM